MFDVCLPFGSRWRGVVRSWFVSELGMNQLTVTALMLEVALSFRFRKGQKHESERAIVCIRSYITTISEAMKACTAIN